MPFGRSPVARRSTVAESGSRSVAAAESPFRVGATRAVAKMDDLILFSKLAKFSGLSKEATTGCACRVVVDWAISFRGKSRFPKKRPYSR